ncbi:hypothetical protein RhiirA1_478883 [Rhizophagus irregularis]|uniref:Uncharacterized protein n=1 Tax=Rhizophagus irregularis TaxID=588596 RepID=A0A2N0QRF5_9GLOM|nr:hypothetical protein RhiirA1_478883 [Rhizophagus irregularis]GET64730.1 hypothetical protein GLOIN_2v1834867 [Rhizophagus irregularis DAOM 181602=DAOM 197198]
MKDFNIRWLEQFVIAAEDLMRIVMLTINNECNKELEKLEDQKQDLSSYKELRNWKILGKRYIQKDIDDINNNRNDLDR